MSNHPSLAPARFAKRYHIIDHGALSGPLRGANAKGIKWFATATTVTEAKAAEDAVPT